MLFSVIQDNSGAVRRSVDMLEAVLGQKRGNALIIRLT